MNAPPILRLHHVVKRFGTFEALKDINLDIEEGEFLTVVGPSGSGKSTLIRLLAGMDELTEGSIFLRDKRIDKMPANLRPTCMVFQSLALFPHMSVGENIEFPLSIRNEDKARRHTRVLELLSLLRLPENYYQRPIQQCSGGERQRVALARALAFEPEILFFDEPLSALDYRLRKALEKELKELHARTGKTFVYITHSLEEAMVMSDRIAILNAGQFEQIAVADEIYNRPTNRFVAEFMGEVNIFDAEGVVNGGLRSQDIEIHIKEGTGELGGVLSPGEKGIIMVRPECMRFLTGADTADFIVHGMFRDEYALGSRLQYEFETSDGSTVTVEKLREDRFGGQPGSEVTLGFDAENVHLIRDT